MDIKLDVNLYLICIALVIFFLIGPGSLLVKAGTSKKTTQEEVFLKDYDSVDSIGVSSDIPSLKEVSVKMLFSLTIVLVLLVISVLVIKKFFPKTIGLNKETGVKLVRVIEKSVISPKQEIYLLWAVDRMLVVAANNGNMNLLTEIKDKNVITEKLSNDFSDNLAKEQIKFSEIYNV